MVQEGIMQSFQVCRAVAENSSLPKEKLAADISNREVMKIGGLSVVSRDKMAVIDTCLRTLRGLNCE